MKDFERDSVTPLAASEQQRDEQAFVAAVRQRVAREQSKRTLLRLGAIVAILVIVAAIAVPALSKLQQLIDIIDPSIGTAWLVVIPLMGAIGITIRHHFQGR